MNKRFLIMLMSLALALSFCACSLAKPDATPGADEAGEDRLVGYFITRDYVDLFDMEAFAKNHAGDILSGGEIENTDEYQGRLYAEKIKDENGIEKYVFNDLEGTDFFVTSIGEGTNAYTRVHAGEGITGGNYKMLTDDENGEIIDLTGTIYIPVGERIILYFNPVYQSSTGEVYLMSGDGSDVGMATAGISINHRIEQYLSPEEEGENAYSCKVELTVASTCIPEQLTIIEMGKGGKLIKTESLDVSEMPEKYQAADGTEYLIIETVSIDETGNMVLERELVMPEAEESSIRVFRIGENGFACYEYCQVIR